MNILLTGGAGFIGRWVAKQILDDDHHLWILDDLSNGQMDNINEFHTHPKFKQFVQGDIKDEALIESIFDSNRFDICYHLGASINVQDSIDDPRTTFHNDTIGTFFVLEQCRRHQVKMVFMSTCMVYSRSSNNLGIDETHPTKPASPYAGSKIAAENLVLSYFHAYGLPVVVVRPFNTYGPFQKTGGEGGVVAIFIRNQLKKLPLSIYGDGNQTRDLLFVEDCARFVIQAGYSSEVDGEILNAGLGRDISINELAALISNGEVPIQHVKHIHPQSEIQKLLCNYEKAKRLLGWEPQVSLEEGIAITREWLKTSYLV